MELGRDPDPELVSLLDGLLTQITEAQPKLAEDAEELRRRLKAPSLASSRAPRRKAKAKGRAEA